MDTYKLNCSNPVLIQIFTLEFPNMQISRILNIARNIVLPTLVHKIARMLENAVLNVFGVILRLSTLFITSDAAGGTSIETTFYGNLSRLKARGVKQ